MFIFANQDLQIVWVMDDLVCFVSAVAPFTVEVRIVFIMILLLSLAAFVMSAFAAYLFYKFYRDTIKPIPVLNLEQTDASCALKLVNNGHSAFYVFRIFFSKNGKISSSILDFLPVIQEETLYAMFAKAIEERKVLPDQQLKIFDIDFPFLSNYMGKDQIQSITNHLDGIQAEVHCHDIGKRYKSVFSMIIHVK
jgi:hypothetical protein